MNKHTKGEWHIGGHNKCTIYDQYGQRIANSFEGVLVIQRGDDECAANARLIASAPDLVIELRQAIIQMEMAAECIENGRYDEALLHVSSLMRSKKEVLAKATGESA